MQGGGGQGVPLGLSPINHPTWATGPPLGAAVHVQVSFLLSLNHVCLFIYERKLHWEHDAYAVVSRVQEGPGSWKHSEMEILRVSALSRSQMGGSEEQDWAARKAGL